MSLKYVLVAITGGKKHAKHIELVAQLEADGFQEKEIDLPSKADQICSAEMAIRESLKNLSLIIIYISKESENNACLKLLTQLAEKEGIRVVSIWLEDAETTFIPASIDAFSDAVTPYSSSMTGVFSGSENPWKLPDNSELDKRKIKKHTCG